MADTENTQDIQNAFDPTKNPEIKLMSHIVQKGWQSGSVIGVIVSIPYLFYKGRLGPTNIASVAGKWAVGGGLGALAFTFLKMNSIAHGSLFSAIIGGASIGTALGVAAHMPKSLSTAGPNKMIEEAASLKTTEDD